MNKKFDIENIKKFNYNGTEFDIIDSFVAEDHEGHHKFQVLKTSRSIIIPYFPFFPEWDDNKRFRWFKKGRARFRLYISRKDYFDEWSYTNEWNNWKHEFRLEEFLNN